MNIFTKLLTMSDFHFTSSDLCEVSQAWDDHPAELSEFDKRLCSSWDKAMEDGHFRYKLDIEETRIVGEKNYVCQLNIMRAQARRKPDEITTVNQPFNPATFNFNKIRSGEILFDLVKDTGSHCTSCVKEQSKQEVECNGRVKQGRNLVIINVSPLEYGHVLLVPNPDACRPQILTEEAILLAVEMILLSKHRGFRVGFNSLCAFASVNHQHLHAFYLDRELYVESSPVEHLCNNLYELVTMPTKGFAFQLHGSTPEEFARMLFSVADYFRENEIAHNLYMTRGPVFGEPRDSKKRTVRAYLWPRKKFIGLKDEAAFNVALVELGGHLPIKIREQFHSLDEVQIEDTIREAALEEEDYERVKEGVRAVCCKTTAS